VNIQAELSKLERS